MPLLQTLAETMGIGALRPILEGHFISRLLIDLACVIILTRAIYYRHYRRGDLFLTFFSLNLVIFLIAFLLNRVEMTLGAAFGLFAVFSMLRYRTEDISAKDMTYIFMVIALGLLMAIASGGWIMLVLIGALVLVCAWIMEGNWLVRRELAQEVLYDNIQLVGLDARQQLIGDLRARTGLNVHRVDVRQIDFLKDAARLTVYYYAA
jgi:hypothetical protein